MQTLQPAYPRARIAVSKCVLLCVPMSIDSAHAESAPKKAWSKPQLAVHSISDITLNGNATTCETYSLGGNRGALQQAVSLAPTRLSQFAFRLFACQGSR